jgi:photosystem II stability/assembly factor-like uncharacterized protein
MKENVTRQGRLHRLICQAWLIGALMCAPLHAQEPCIGGKARLKAWKQHQDMANRSPFKELQWQSLGPKFAGGRIESIDAPRNDLKTIYCGVGAGGIWKTVNGGLTWKPIFQHESTFAIGDLCVAPGDPNTLWVGTGECHLSGSSYAGTGVFKSSDAGETWTNMGLHESTHIGTVAIDPVDKNVVYVAAMGRKRSGGERGIYKTTHGGKTFTRVLYEGERVAFVDLVIDPNNRDRLFCSAWDRSGGNKSAVFRSDDQGKSWKRLAGGLPEKQIDRVAIAVSASQPGVVCALMADRSTPNLRRRRDAAILLRSNDYGETWARTRSGYVPTYVGWDFCDLRVAPDNADHVFVGGLRLMISHDGGKTFQGKTGWAPNRDPSGVFRLHAHRGIGMHLDVHDIWIDPQHPDRVLLGNDGGLYISQDRGQTWLHLNNLPIAEFYRIHLDNQEPFHIWGGTQDNASFVGPSTTRFETGVDDGWKQVFLDPWTGGDGFATFPDPVDPNITYYTQQNGDLKRSRLGQLRADKGIRPRAKDGDKELRFAWDTPFFASSHWEETVLYCAAQRVMRSDDRGDSWQAISPDLGRSGLVALAESPLDPNCLGAGGGRGEVHLTADGGKTWKPAGPGLPKKSVRDVVLSAHNADRVYVVLSGAGDHDCASYVFVSNDFGVSWKSIAGQLPDESVNTLAEDPQNEELLFVGTDLGVYVCTDCTQVEALNDAEGDSAPTLPEWHSLCLTLPTAPVVDLAVHARDNALVAATHGLSIFLLEIDTIRAAAGK